MDIQREHEISHLTQQAPNMLQGNRKSATAGDQTSSLSFLQGVRDCVPTLLGYVGIGVAAGVVGNSAQLHVLEIGLMAALVYAGASQFIICAMLIAASSPAAIVATTFLVNLRHLLMSTAMAPHLTQYGLLKNVGIGALLTDETFGVASLRMSRGLPLNDRWMYGLNLTAYLVWIASCMIGGWIGGWIPDPHRFGLDFALTAMFAALLILQLVSMPDQWRRNLALVISAAGLTYALSIFMSLYMAVLLATIAAAAIGVYLDS